MQILKRESCTPNVQPLERWLSITGGAALALRGWRAKSPAGAVRIVGGLFMVARGITGNCQVYRALGIGSQGSRGAALEPCATGVVARASITLQQPVETVFAFWRQLENLPHFMRHLRAVQVKGGGYSHWVAEGLGGKTFEWDAEIINEIPNQLIAWKSLPGSDVDSAGSVRFNEAPGGRGTEVRVKLQYDPPAGAAGAYLARLFGREPEQEISADLYRLKQWLEAGEVATTEGQPKAGATRQPPSRREEERQEDLAT